MTSGQGTADVPTGVPSLPQENGPFASKQDGCLTAQPHPGVPVWMKCTVPNGKETIPPEAQGRLGLGHTFSEPLLQKPRWAAQGATKAGHSQPLDGLLTTPACVSSDACSPSPPPQLGPHKSAVGKAEGDDRTGPQPQSEELSRSPHKHNAPAARPAWPGQSLLQEHMFMCVPTDTCTGAW